MEGAGISSGVTGMPFLSSSGKNSSFDIIHPCSNFGFKRVMHRPDVVMGFLNSILQLTANEKIHSVRFLDEEYPAVTSCPDFTVDVLCESTGGNLFLIAMQYDLLADYTTRALLAIPRLDTYWIRQNVETGEYHRKHPTYISVFITNIRFPDGTFKSNFTTEPLAEPDIINTYCMTNVVDHTVLNDNRVVIVFLDNFKKTEEQLETIADKWLFAFKDETLGWGVYRFPCYKHICHADKIKDDIDPGLSDFYHTLTKDVVRLAGDLDRYENEILAVNYVLSGRDELMRLQESTEGSTKESTEENR